MLIRSKNESDHQFTKTFEVGQIGGREVPGPASRRRISSQRESHAGTRFASAVLDLWRAQYFIEGSALSHKTSNLFKKPSCCALVAHRNAAVRPNATIGTEVEVVASVPSFPDLS